MIDENTEVTVAASRPGEMMSPPTSLIEACMRMPPRNMAAVSEILVTNATLSPEIAKSCIYTVPVGKDPETGLQRFKLGESIRLAEIAVDAFGRLMVDTRIEELSKDRVIVKAVAIDVQKMAMYPGIGSASITKKSREKIAIAAATSIAFRNAVLRMVKVYTQAIVPKIKDAIVWGLSEKGSVDEALNSLCAEFTTLGVTKEQLKAALAREKSNKDRVVILLGILNGVRDGMYSIGEIFGEQGTDSKPKMDPPKAKAATEAKAQAQGQAATAPTKSGPAQPTAAHSSAFAGQVMAMMDVLGWNLEKMNGFASSKYNCDGVDGVPLEKQLDFLGALNREIDSQIPQ